MIYPKVTQDQQFVSHHYDELDVFYREFWGEHLHHGLWKTHSETPEEAVKQLIDYAADAAQIAKGTDVCDIGCGYGGTVRSLSERGAHVTGFTISPIQHAYALSKSFNHDKERYVLQDWLVNDLPDHNFDAALSIESSEHMVDKEKFFKEAFRVLRHGGKFVVCAWLAKENPTSWEINTLLEPICREGRLPSMGTVKDYLDGLSAAGFTNIRFEDLTNSVKKTWSICLWRVFKALFTNPAFRRYLLNSSVQERGFLKTIGRIIVAYRRKTMLYGLFTAQRSST